MGKKMNKDEKKTGGKKGKTGDAVVKEVLDIST